MNRMKCLHIYIISYDIPSAFLVNDLDFALRMRVAMQGSEIQCAVQNKQPIHQHVTHSLVVNYRVCSSRDDSQVRVYL